MTRMFPLSAIVAAAAALLAGVVVLPGEAGARSCRELRALCWTMRDDDRDCARPYRRCLETGVFITPLGRRFVATRRN